MPIERSNVLTVARKGLGVTSYEPRISVIFTNELVTTDVYDLAWSSVHQQYLPYLFMGYFTGMGIHKWYFSNANRHEEMRQAVEESLRRSLDYTYGQIWFNLAGLRSGNLLFDRARINRVPPDKKKAEQRLIESINPNYLFPGFRIDYNSPY